MVDICIVSKLYKLSKKYLNLSKVYKRDFREFCDFYMNNDKLRKNMQDNVDKILLKYNIVNKYGHFIDFVSMDFIDIIYCNCSTKILKKSIQEYIKYVKYITNER